MLQITLRAARVNCGLTLQEAAAITNKCPKTLARYEKDSSKIPRDLMEQLLKVYRVPKDHIFFGPESVFTERQIAM